VAARANLRSVLADHDLEVGVEIIDLLLDPRRGLRDGILVTPTLVKAAPAPEQRVIGDLRDRSALLSVLDSEVAGGSRGQEELFSWAWGASAGGGVRWRRVRASGGELGLGGRGRFAS
jgi:hypothetical protein